MDKADQTELGSPKLKQTKIPSLNLLGNICNNPMGKNIAVCAVDSDI
jgi:hypothetical protein